MSSDKRNIWTDIKNHPIFWIVMLFVLSVIIRIPNLDRPLSKHHEFNTATALVIFKIWEQKGIAHFHYVPAQLYPEKFTQDFYKSRNHPLSDENGNLFYTSHPPLGFYIPYVTFSLLGIPFKPLPLQVFNMLFQLISAIFIYKIILLLIPKEKNEVSFAALFGVSVYLFSPASLWFQGNVFFVDQFYINFFIISIYFSLKILMSGKQASYRDLLFFGLSVAVFTYIDWTGILFGGSVILVSLLSRNRDLPALKISLITILAVSIPLIFTLYQYAQIHGTPALIATSLGRFSERGLVGNESLSILEGLLKFLKKWRFIMLHYATGFLPAILLMCSFVFILLKQKKWKFPTLKFDIKILIALSIIPLLLHHIIFIRYTMFHDFAVLKAIPFLSVFIGLTCYHLFKKGHKSTLLISYTLLLISSIGLYYYVNRPGDFSRNGDRYDAMKEIGLEIKSRTSDDEVVFLDGIKGPQIIYYAERNIFSAANKEAAMSILNEIEAEKGLLFHVKDQKVVGVEPISLPIR